jgi:Fe2+ or Zn2+ uptake regulation protein
MESHIKDHHGFYIDQSKTVLYGQCGSCAGKTGRVGTSKSGGNAK